MSDTPQGPGWWQASDGRWYPPTPTPTPAPAPAPSAVDDGDLLPAGPPPGTAPQTAGKATGALIASILSFVVCPFIPAIVALVLAAQAKKQIRESYGRLGGDGLITASRIISVLNLAVFVPALLLAIALPTFLGAQARAQDRAAQSELRNAFVAERTLATDTGAWTDDPAALAGIEPTLRFEQGLRPLQEDVVYLAVNGDLVGLSTKSESGTCFYILGQLAEGEPGYAEDEGCRSVDVQEFLTAWE